MTDQKQPKSNLASPDVGKTPRSFKVKPRHAVMIAVCIIALVTFGARPIKQDTTFHGDEALAEALSERAPKGTHRLAFVDNGTFAGLGAKPTDEFEIGSVTKMMTVELLRQAIENDEISLDTHVADLIDFPATEPPVTIEDLANHTAGLGRAVPGASYVRGIIGLNPYNKATTNDVLEVAATAKIGSREYSYSNFGYAILGNVLAKVAGTTYEDLLQTRIFTPLGMENTFVATFGSVSESAPRGYLHSGWKAQPWEMDGYAPAGAVRSTAADLEIFVKHVITNGVPEYGWVYTDDGLVWHNGMTGGFSSQVVINPASGGYLIALADTLSSPDSLLLEMMREQ